ncbi:hypothetical protein M514_21485 [Trichuris suis]|uniref:CCHC-type domain-containing protein n=1 Tax=Trichuris suis TaxID=68888 RepID=A0A085N9Q2_9BILA|nr:hypothetical protein M514_21485 [Trichuris suis]
MAAGCDFENFNTEAALLVQFVNGMGNQSVKTTLLAKGEDLTFENALGYLQLEEDVQREDAKNSEAAMDAKACHAVKAHVPIRQVNGTVRKCGRCGKGDHGKDDCPFTPFKCFNCGRIGHLTRMCRRKQPDVPDKRQQDAPTRAQRHQKKVRQVQGIESHILQAYHLGASSPFTVEVLIAGHQTVMELDTGASVTIADSVLWERMGCPALSPPTVQLRSFTGHVIPLKGEAIVTVECGGQLKHLPIRIADQPVANVMRRDWIQAFGGPGPIRTLFAHHAPTVRRVRSCSRLQEMLDRFASLFQPGLGHCTKIKAHLELKQGAQPVFRKPYPVAFALQEAVEAELERHVQAGTLSRIDRSDWAARSL